MVRIDEGLRREGAQRDESFDQISNVDSAGQQRNSLERGQATVGCVVIATCRLVQHRL